MCSEFNVKSKCGYSRRNAESHTAPKAHTGDTTLSLCHPYTRSGCDPVALQREIVPPRAVGEFRVSPCRKWGKVQMSNCCPQGAAGETSTQRGAEQAPTRISAGEALEAEGTGQCRWEDAVPARVPQHGSALAEAHAACYRSVLVGLWNYPSEFFNPGFPLLFRKIVVRLENTQNLIN